MQRNILLFALFWWVSAPSAAGVCDKLAEVEWLLGEWQAKTPTLLVHESWYRLNDDTFSGVGQTFSSKTQAQVSQESLRLVSMLDEVFFIAKVASNPYPVAFKLIECTNQLAVFSRPEHDFPKMLRYQLVDPYHLRVDVQGEGDSGFSLEFVRQQ